MKTLKLFGTAITIIFMSVNFTSCGYDDGEIWDSFHQLEERVAILETLCKKNNENISSLQTLVDVLESSDYITDVAPMTNDGVEIGYKITFAKAGTITIYHGADGKDGQNGLNGTNGKDGEDGHTPVIGVKQDTDGIYYWTLDGEFIVIDGKKMNVQGKDGVDGKDGLTPQFKIENGYWYISYDGLDWTNVGKATGENGSDSNCIFSDITQDDENVYFTLANGTIITLAKKDEINDDTLLMPDGQFFNSAIEQFLNANTNIDKIKFVANSTTTSETVFVSDWSGTKGYFVANGEWLEIHTNGVEFIANEDCGGMFYYINGHPLSRIEFGDSFNTSNVTNMSMMFSGCENLTSLDLSKFNTAKVVQMENMFYGCKSLNSLNIENFNTSNVVNMHFMFHSCENLSELDVRKFETSNVVDMGGMFYECKSLTSLDVSSFNTEYVTDMSFMFSFCNNLASIDVSKFNTGNAMDMEAMFQACENLSSLELNNFDTSNVTNMSAMFNQCSKLASLDLSVFDTSKVTTMSYMFQSCYNLKELNVSSFNTSNVTHMDRMFAYCENLTILDVSSFDTTKVSDMSYMFLSCSNLTSLDLTNFSFVNKPSFEKMLASIGTDANAQPTPIIVSEDGYTYLTSQDSGIGYYAKFVKLDGTDW